MNTLTNTTLNHVKEFFIKKWKERAAELGRPEPENLAGACKFASLFIQALFGGEIQGNQNHQYNILPDGQRVDLTEGSPGSENYEHDEEFWSNPDHIKYMELCNPRVQRWVAQFRRTKQAYLSPANGALNISIIRDSRPYATISLDLGIPNFTVFSLKFPLVEDKPSTMRGLVAEAVHTLLDEMSAFMLSLNFEENIIVGIYAAVLVCFKGMTGEADTSKSQSAISKDPTVKTFEGTFKLPMEFINETYDKVVTAAGKIVKRPPVHRHMELTYEKPSKTTVQDARTVIKNFRNRSLKSQPSPMYVIVYDSFGKARGCIPIGPQFKNQLLNTVYKKGSSKTEFTPTVKFDNDIEMKTTNAEGIPKSIYVGDEKYTPVATISDDMALYSNTEDEYIVKLPDGRCVAFADFPPVAQLKDENYPVPTVYTNWTALPKGTTPESSDEGEAVDERGVEVIEGTETETNPVADLKPDDEKNEQLEEGIDELPDGQEKTSAIRGWKKTYTIPRGTILYHGTSAKFSPEEIDTPAWFSTSESVADNFKTWHGGRGKVYKYRTIKPIKLPRLDSRDDFESFCYKFEIGDAPEDIVATILQTDLPGWIMPNNYPDGDDILLVSSDALEPVKTTEPLLSWKTSGWREDYRGVTKRPSGMSSQSWQAIQKQLKEEDKKFDPDQYVDPLTNMFGKLAPDLRKRLVAVLRNPTQKTWSNAYSIILNQDTWETLWQAVIKVDPFFPRSGPSGGDDDRLWDRIPTRETLIAAMRLANPAKQDTPLGTDYDKDFMKSLGIGVTSGSKRADHIDENGYWAGAGGGASGILPICTSTGRICLAWRSSAVVEGNCWGTIGGAILQDMSPADSAKEELKEEVGYHGSIRLIPAFVFTHDKFKYHNFLGLVPSEFSLNPMEGGSSNLQFTDETDALAWMTWDDLQNDIQSNPGDYHSGVLKLLQQSSDQIRKICEASSNKSTGG